MSTKSVIVPTIGEVTFYKRRGAKTIKLSITHSGTVRVSLPPWAPYRLGLQFVTDKQAWILSQRPQSALLADKSRIGKSHHIVFVQTSSIAKPSSRLVGNEIRISLPPAMISGDLAAQIMIRKACIRALKREAKQLLPLRLEQLASKHNFHYSKVGIKELRSRWGSCNQQRAIVLNCYLMQLPWQLIDYVLLHELLHTRILAHGKPFWHELATYVPDLANVRKTMRATQPTLLAQNDKRFVA